MVTALQAYDHRLREGHTTFADPDERGVKEA
jgi:hypothetical protein